MKTRLRLQVNHECNYDCVFCHNDNTKEKINKISVTEQINAYLRLDRIFKIDDITITGGEPFVNNKVWEIVSFIRAKDENIPIKILTNGAKITNEIIEKITINKISIKMSIYGYSDEIAEKITKKKQRDYFQKISKTICELHKRNINVTVNLVMNSLIQKEMDKIIQNVRRISENIKIKVIEMVSPIGGQVMNLYIPINKDSPYYKLKYECCNLECNKCISKWSPTILPNGEIQICEKLPYIIINSLKSNKISYKGIDYSKNIIQNSGDK